jgi:diacylglycerol kinase family enzyme
MARRALCLVNPKAKSGEASAERLESLLAAAGLEPRVVRSGSPEEAVAVIAAGHSAPIDVGLIETEAGRRRFLNVASLGLAAEVARHHQGTRKRLLGVLAYPLSWWAAWRARRPLRLDLILDGVPRSVRCLQLAVGCGRYYGGGLTVDEKASHFDGLLRLYYVRPVPLLTLLWLLPALWLGRLKRHREAETWSGRQVEVSSRRPLPIDVDGDLGLNTPARFSVEPAALAVFLPEQALRRTGAEPEAVAS